MLSLLREGLGAAACAAASWTCAQEENRTCSRERTCSAGSIIWRREQGLTADALSHDDGAAGCNAPRQQWIYHNDEITTRETFVTTEMLTKDSSSAMTAPQGATP